MNFAVSSEHGWQGYKNIEQFFSVEYMVAKENLGWSLKKYIYIADLPFVDLTYFCSKQGVDTLMQKE